MPRYRYKKVVITSKAIGGRKVELKRVGDAIAVLEALGDGKIGLLTTDGLHAIFPIAHIRGKNEQAVWDLIDGEMDVAEALRMPMQGRIIDPAANGRWPNCKPDILAVLIGAPPDMIYRLRHFGALMLTGIRISENLYAISPRNRCAIDARLTETEKIIAFDADLHSAARDLLYLR